MKASRPSFLSSFQSILLIVLFTTCLQLQAQTSPDIEQGMKPYGSYHGGDLDHISLTNGNLFFEAPLFAYSQRGGELAYPITLRYNNKNFSLYQIQPPCPPGTPKQQCPLRLQLVFGPNPLRTSRSSHGSTVTLGFDGFPSTGLANIDTSLSFNGNEIFATPASVVMPDGSLHQLAPAANNTMVAPDGSGYFISSNGNLTGSNGTLYSPVIEDRNGNQMGTADTLGRQIPTFPGPSSPDSTLPTSTASLVSCPTLNYAFQPVAAAYTWNLPTFSGGTLPLIVCYTSVLVRTGQPNTPPIFQVNKSFTMLQSVVFPDNTYWAFKYDAADPNNTASYAFGDLLKIVFPTGGSLSYTWGLSGMQCGSGVDRAVLTRTVDANDGLPARTWHYNDGVVTDPQGNDTVHDITGLGGSCSLYETKTRYYQGSQTAGTLLKTVDTEYQYTINPYDPAVIGGGVQADATSVANVFPFRVTTTLPNGLVSKVETDYDNALVYHGALDGITSNIKECPATDPGGNPNGDCHYYFYGAQSTNSVTTYTGSYGKAIAKREFDWGQGVPGPPLRETQTTYQWQVNSAYLTANLLNLPAMVKILDGAGHLCAETDYFYDETTPVAPSPAISTQHTVPTTAVRGNLTTTIHKLSTTPCSPSATWTNIVSHNAWFDTGELQSSTDAMGHTTTHLYDSAYAGAYSTQSCSPQTGAVTHCVSGTYDFNTALLTSLTNENATTQASGNTQGDAAHTSTFGYDTYWRIKSAQAPPDPANSSTRAHTDFTYSLANAVPITVNRQKSITDALMDSFTATFDGVGRTVKTEHPTPAGVATVDTHYDELSQVASVSNPYFSTGDPTYGITQSFYDALGRVTKVIPQDGTASSNYSSTDYSNLPTVTVTDPAGTLRRSRSDALGRLVEVDEPGPGANTAGTPGTGTITISGALASSTTSGSKATGWFSVNGSDGFVVSCPPDGLCNPKFAPKTWDVGTVGVSVNGMTVQVPYGQNSNAATMASSLGSSLTPHPVTISDSGTGTITMTADTPGPNYSLSGYSQSNDPADFGAEGSFSVTVSGSTLSGGVYPTTNWDSGTLAVTVNGFQASAAYSQSQNSTPSALATALAAALNAAGSPVTANASGSTITLTAKTVGPATNYSVSGGTSTSFTASSTTLTGGTDAGGLFTPYITLYTYDTLGNLTCVEQHGDLLPGSAGATGCSADPANDATSKWRVRRFTYDSLSRLLTAKNPESGTITYTYDLDGELLQKTSPAPNQTGAATMTVSYCYDALHRVTGKGYGAQSCPLATPVVTYTYDSGANAKGKLVSMTDQAGTATYSYDVLGRLVTETRTLPGDTGHPTVSKTISYEYNLDGSLKALHYPSGAVVTYTPWSNGTATVSVPQDAKDLGHNINYVSGGWYGADIGLTSFISGSGGPAAINNTFSYNTRLQPVTMEASLSPTNKIFSITYDFHLGNGNNGNVWGILNNREHTRDQSFTYDQLNRLLSAQNAGTNCAAITVNGKTEYWGNSYGYDAWGNLLAKTVTKCGAENMSLTADTHNWVHASGTDYQYDAAGNMTFNATPPVQSYTFDQENRLTGAAGYTYTYDGDGNRVRKSNGTTASSGTLYWYMTPGIVAETDLAGTTKSEYIFFDGERVARRDGVNGAGGVFYYFSDHLKTASVITDAAGVTKAESDYYPWGGELQFVANDSNHYKFTGKERDNETQLDYFGARHYSNGLGRWVSADWSATPVPVPYADFRDPQTLNLYGFVGGNPASKADADGHDAMPGHEGACAGQRMCQQKDDDKRSITAWLGSELQNPKNGSANDTAREVGPTGVSQNDLTADSVKKIGDGLEFIGETAAVIDPSGIVAAGSAFGKGKDGEGILLLGLAFLPGGKKTRELVHVYQIVKDGKVIYVGITIDLARRELEHGAKLDRIVTMGSTLDARAVEQALIQHHGLQKNGGTLVNKINSISPRNPKFSDYVKFGFDVLRNVSHVF